MFYSTKFLQHKSNVNCVFVYVKIFKIYNATLLLYKDGTCLVQVNADMQIYTVVNLTKSLIPLSLFDRLDH